MTFELTLTRLAGSPDAGRLLVVGPSLGTSVEALWTRCAGLLTDTFEVIGWDLPGHGRGRPTTTSFTVEDLAAAVRAEAAGLTQGRPAAYAGVSVAGEVAFALSADPGPFEALVAIASAPRMGETGSWHERADLVRRAGTPVMVSSSAQRWFAPGFTERDPGTSGALLTSLAEADAGSYALICEALAAFDATTWDLTAHVPVHVLAGEHDPVVTPEQAAQISATTVGTLTGCGHLPPAEDPQQTARVLRELLVPDPYTSGMAVRRQVLGDEHVDRAEAARTPFTDDFQDLITRYAWGGIWTRPGLDRRTRSAMVLTAMMAHGHWDEFAMHVRAALGNGLTPEEISEVILQGAVYLGVPTANTAYKVASKVLTEEGR